MKPVVLLLIAGRSRRFWPLTEKSLWSISGKTILEHQIDRLKKAGLSEIIVVGGKHNLNDIKKRFPSLHTIEQKDLDQGMQGAVVSALPKFKGKPILIVGANDVIDTSAYKDLLKAMNDAKNDGAILAKKVHDYFPGGYIKSSGGRIQAIIEKPGKGKEPSKLINIVAHLHRNPDELLRILQTMTSNHDDGYEQALTKLFATHRYVPISYEGSWNPVKYPWHLLSLTERLLKEIKKPSFHKTAKIHRSAVIEGNVVLAEGVRVLPHATIIGPCSIGPHTIIGNNTLVRHSSIGAHCVMGYNTEVVRSSLGDHIWTHSSYLGDSVIGDNVAFGAGSVTANLRLDEEEISSLIGNGGMATGLTKFGSAIGSNTRIGIHVSIAPGMKIGANSFIGSSAYITQDIPENSFVKSEHASLIIKQNTKKAPHPVERQKFRKKSGL